MEKIYTVKFVDYGWTAKIRTQKNYAIGDLCIVNGCICSIIKEG